MSPSDQLQGWPAIPDNEGQETPMTATTTFIVKVELSDLVLAAAILLHALH
jgi:hypothetical protein